MRTLFTSILLLSTLANADIIDYYMMAILPSIKPKTPSLATFTCKEGMLQEDTCNDNGVFGTHRRTCDASGSWGAWSSCVADSLFPPSNGIVYYVSASGSDIKDDPEHGSDEAPWRSLQYAVTRLAPNDTLIVRSGYYFGSVSINVSGTSSAPITIRSETPYGAKLSGGISVNGDYVTLYALDIEQPQSGAGITIGETSGVKILNNLVHDCPMYGITVASASASDYNISGNTLSYNGQEGMILRGARGSVENNKILEVVAFHPKLASINVSNGDDADGMAVVGEGHMIRHNLIANYADPKDTHNYYLSDPSHNAHADCFDMRTVRDITIEGNTCWSNFHVSKGVIFNGSDAMARENITISNNIFEYRDVGLDLHTNYFAITNANIYNNLLKSQIDDVIESYYNPGNMVPIPGNGMVLSGVDNYSVFNNITVDCDNHTTPNVTGNPIIISGGSGESDYNFYWNSDGAVFSGANPGEHGSKELNPMFRRYDSALHGQNDYHLQASSPLLGKGSATLSSDKDGVLRPTNGAYEPGPYEHIATPTLATPEWISEHVNNDILELSPTSCSAPSSEVNVTIARWQGNKKGAMIIRFDDGTRGHALCGLEALGSRGLTGTWYFTPARDGYTNSVTHATSGETIVLADQWAKAPELGQELANHTLNHSYETDPAKWRSEVEGASDIIWQIRHGLPLQRNASLIAFNNSSSVAWPWAKKEEIAILNEFSNIERQSYMGLMYHNVVNRTFSVPQGEDADAMYCGHSSLHLNANGECVDDSEEVYNFGVNLAISDGSVYQAAFHGILSTPNDSCAAYTNTGSSDAGVGGVQLSELETFLDNVKAHQDELWVAGAIELYKYTQEAQRSTIRMHQSCSDRIYFDLVSSLGALYDEPLSLIVNVPDNWSTCKAMQGARTLSCHINADHTVLIDAVPNSGRIVLIQN